MRTKEEVVQSVIEDDNRMKGLTITFQDPVYIDKFFDLMYAHRWNRPQAMLYIIEQFFDNELE